MICQRCAFYFTGDLWKRNMSPEKNPILQVDHPHVLSCSPGETAGAAHTGRLWRWSKEAERMSECGELAWKHTWLPLTEKGWNNGALTFCFFLPPFQSFLQPLALLLSSPTMWHTLSALAIKWGGKYVSVTLGYDGAHDWQRLPGTYRPRLEQCSVERALTVKLWALRLSFSWQNSHCVLFCYLPLL